MRENKKISYKEKKLSAKRECREVLRGFIFDINTIPENTVLRNYEEIWRENDYSMPDGSTREEILSFHLEQTKKIVDECFVKFSHSYKEMLLKNCEALELKNHPDYDNWNLQMASLRLAQEHYHYLYRLNTNLRAIADFFSHLRKNDYQFAGEIELITSDGATVALPAFETQLKRDGTTGKIHKGFSEAVIGVDLDRIRACEICNRIFWAKRTESSTCTPQHYETLKKRRSRALTDEEKAERKAQREANKRRNKKLKEKRSEK